MQAATAVSAFSRLMLFVGFSALISGSILIPTFYYAPYFQGPSPAAVQGVVDQVSTQQTVQQYQIDTLIQEVNVLNQLLPPPPTPPIPSPPTPSPVWNGTAIALQTIDGSVSRITIIQSGQLLIRQSNTIRGVTPDYTFIVQALGYVPQNTALRGKPNGYASLDTNGLVPYSQLPPIHTITVYNITAYSQLTSLTNASIGDYALFYFNATLMNIYVLMYEPPTVLGNWISVGGGSSAANNSVITIETNTSGGPLFGPHVFLTNQDLGNPWQLGGNSYGVPGILGTLDAYDLSLVVNGSIYLTLNLTTTQMQVMVNTLAPNFLSGQRYGWYQYPTNWIASGDSTFADSSAQDLVINSQDNAIRLGNSGANANSTMVISNDAVGIGISNPSAQLDILGNIRFRNYTSVNATSISLLANDFNGYLLSVRLGDGLEYNTTTNTLSATNSSPISFTTINAGTGIEVLETGSGNWTIINTSLLNLTSSNTIGNIIELNYNISNQTVSIQAFAIVGLNASGDGLSVTTYPDGFATLTSTAVSEIVSLAPESLTFFKSPSNNTWFANFTAATYNQSVVPTIVAGDGILVNYTNNGTMVVVQNIGLLELTSLSSAIKVNGTNGNLTLDFNGINNIISNTSTLSVLTYTNGTVVLTISENATTPTTSFTAGRGMLINETNYNVTISTTAVLNITSTSSALEIGGNNDDLVLSFSGVTSVTSNSSMLAATTFPNGSVVITLLTNETSDVYLYGGRGILTSSPSGYVTISTTAILNITSNSSVLQVGGNNDNVILTFDGIANVISNSSELQIERDANGTIVLTYVPGTPTGVQAIDAGQGINVTTNNQTATIINTGVLKLVSGSESLVLNSTTGDILLNFNGVSTVVSESPEIVVNQTANGTVVLTYVPSTPTGVQTIDAGQGINVTTNNQTAAIINTGVLKLISGSESLVLNSTTGDVLLNFNGVSAVVSESPEIVVNQTANGTVVLTYHADASSGIQAIVGLYGINATTLNQTTYITNDGVVQLSAAGNFVQVFNEGNGTWSIASATPVTSLSLVGTPALSLNASFGDIQITSSALFDIVSNSSVISTSSVNGTAYLNFAGLDGNGSVGTIAFWTTNSTLGSATIGSGLLLVNQTLVNTGVTAIAVSGTGLSTNTSAGAVLITGNAIVNATSYSPILTATVVDGTLYLNSTAVVGMGTSNTLAVWQSDGSLGSASVGQGLNLTQGQLVNTGVLSIDVNYPVENTGTNQSPNITLAASGVAAGSYTYANLTVNAYGLITSASSSVQPIVTVNVTAPVQNTGTSTEPNIGLVTSGVIAGIYTYANLTVNAYGLITSASSGVQPIVTLNVTAPVQNTGTSIEPNIGLVTSGVTAGIYTYANLTVNAYGLITSASSSAQPVVTVNVTAPVQNTGTSIEPNIGLVTSGVTAGIYAYANLTVNAYGLITAAYPGVQPITNLSVIAPVQNTGSSTNPIIGLLTSGVAAGTYTYPSFVVNAFGLLTYAANGTQPVASVTVAAPIQNTGSSTTPIIGLNYSSTNFALSSGHLALVQSGVLAGTYSPSSVTVNAFGIVTAASISTSADIIAALGYTPANASTPIVSALYVAAPVVNLGSQSNPNITLQTNVTTPGSYAYPSSITTDTYGRVTQVTAGSAPSNIPPGGTAGQLLIKNSPTNGDLSWNGNSGNAVITGSFVTGGTITSNTTSYPNYGYNTANRMAFGETYVPPAELGSVVQFGSGSTSRNMVFAFSKTGVRTSFFGNDGTNMTIGNEASGSLVFKNNMVYSASDILASGNTLMVLDASGNAYVTNNVSANAFIVNGGLYTQLLAASGAKVSIGSSLAMTGTSSAPILGVAASGVTSGTYTSPSSVTVGNDGRVTAITSGSAGITSLVAGTNIAITGSGGTLTISATGGGGGTVNGVYAGAGIIVSPNTGNPVVTNNGVITINVGGGLSISGTNYPTIYNTGVLSVAASGGVTASISGGTLSVALATGGYGNAILQGGNTLGTTMQIGTQDSNAIEFMIAYNNRLQINTAGTLSASAYAGTNNALATFDSSGNIIRKNYAAGTTTTTCGGQWSYSHNLGTTPTTCTATPMSPGTSINQQYFASVQSLNSGSVGGYVVSGTTVLVGGNTLSFVGSGVTVTVFCIA